MTTDIDCLLYVGQTVTYTEQVLNDDGQDGPGDGTCDNLVLDPAPAVPQASLSVNPQPLTFGGAPCHSATAPLTFVVTGLEAGLGTLRPSGYYTIIACSSAGNCVNNRWHVGAGVIAFVMPPPSSPPSPAPSPSLAPTPSPTPLVTPLAVVGYSQLNGDISVADTGTVALYSANDAQQVAQVPLGSSKHSAATVRNTTEAETLLVAGLPTGYLRAPSNLPEDSNLESAAYSALAVAQNSGGIIASISPACLVLFLEQRADTKDLLNPKNPAYYQLQAFCQQGASVVPGSLHVGWTGIAYNNFPSQKTVINVKETCIDAGAATNLPGFEKCFSSVKLVPLASGHAEINKPSKLEFTINSSSKYFDSPNPYQIPGDPQYFFLNNRSVPYPVVQVQPNWGPSSYGGNLFTIGIVPPPIQPPYVRTMKGCDDNFQGASTVLGRALKAARFPEPDPQGQFDAHHIKPLCFSGTNDASNGVWLPNDKAPVDLHRPFTTWFNLSNFTP